VGHRTIEMATLHRCETENGYCCRDAVRVLASIDKRFAWLGFDLGLPVAVEHDPDGWSQLRLARRACHQRGLQNIVEVRGFPGSEPIARAVPSVADRHQIVFAQELQFDPAFDREGVHGKPVLPKAKAHSQPVGGQR
jgi:hypothetical protein